LSCYYNVYGLVNTNESVLTVCEKPYNTSKGKVQKEEGIEVLRDGALESVSKTI